VRDAELVPELAVLGHEWILKGGLEVVKEIDGVFGLFKGVFRYRFGRLNLEDRKG